MKTHYYKQYIVDICDDKHLTVDEIVSELQTVFNWENSADFEINVISKKKKKIMYILLISHH